METNHNQGKEGEPAVKRSEGSDASFLSSNWNTRLKCEII